MPKMCMFFIVCQHLQYMLVAIAMKHAMTPLDKTDKLII